MQCDGTGETSECVRGLQHLLTHSACRHQGHHRKSAGCRGVRTDLVIADDNCHRRQEWGEKQDMYGA